MAEKDIAVKCAECGTASKLNGTKERPLTWVCPAVLTKGDRAGEVCGTTNTVEGKPATT
jgi:hypothetical protein